MMHKLVTDSTNLAHFATRFGVTLRPQGFIYESSAYPYAQAQALRDALICKDPQFVYLRVEYA